MHVYTQYTHTTHTHTTPRHTHTYIQHTHKHSFLPPTVHTNIIKSSYDTSVDLAANYQHIFRTTVRLLT